jgi:hypothetical protein
VLVALGAVLLAASPGGNQTSQGDGSGGGEDGQGIASGDGGSGTTVPEDLSFLCDGVPSGEYVNLEAAARNRVEAKIEEFVLTAYGDPGADPAKYEKAVEGLVVGDCFWGSPAGGYVNDWEELARRGGKANAPSGSYDSPTFARELAFFEIDYAQKAQDYQSGASFTEVVGTAVWVSEESDGDPRAWQQSVTVVRNDAGGEWKVSSGQVIPPYVDTEYQSELPPGVG